jgi:hypothetical protein
MAALVRSNAMLVRFHTGVAGSLGWAVFFCVNLAIYSRGVPQEKRADRATSAGPAESAAASPLVDRILRSWKAREDRTKTLHCLWDTAEVRNGKPVERGALVAAQGECWIGRDNRCRFQMTTERVVGPKGGNERKHQATAYDGRVNFILDWKEPSTLPRRGKIWEFKGRLNLFSHEMRPLDWVYRPSLTVNLNPEQFHLVTQDAIVNGLRYTKLRGSNKFGRPGSFWFDPRQDDALVYWESNGSETNKLPLSLRYMADKANGPTLAGWTVLQDDGSDAIAKVKTLEVNKERPAETFRLAFPPGTAVAVNDGPTQEASIVKPDGTKRPIFNLNSISPRLRGVLMQRVDFSVEPQPLRDAIEFIRVRYGMALAIDEASFRAAKIDPSQEVEDDTAGNRLWEVLTWLSAQCPRPFGIFEQNGGLLLKPL